MESNEKNNLILSRSYSNEKLIQNIKSICLKHKVKTGVILSGIGQLKNFEVGYFKNDNSYSKDYFEKPYELLNLSGNIVKDDEDFIVHSHAVLGDENKKLIGGHLIDGKVQVTCEIVILKTEIDAYRKIDEKTGLKSLFFK